MWPRGEGQRGTAAGTAGPTRDRTGGGGSQPVPHLPACQPAFSATPCSSKAGLQPVSSPTLGLWHGHGGQAAARALGALAGWEGG